MAESEHYVVTHTGVDDWKQGDLVARKDFKTTVKNREGVSTDVDKFERLQSLGAIRPATADEVKQGKGVIAPGFTTLSPAMQMELATQQAELDQLRRFVGDQKDKLDSYERLGLSSGAPQTSAADDPSLKVIVEQRAAEIEALKEQAKANEERLKKVIDEAAEKQKAAQKAVGEEGKSAGASPPADVILGGGGQRLQPSGQSAPLSAHPPQRGAVEPSAAEHRRERKGG